MSTLGEKMEPITRQCERCNKSFTITDKRAKHKKFCSGYCRVMACKERTQRLRDQARDYAYAQLTLKDYEREKDFKALREHVEQLEAQALADREFISLLEITLPRMISTGYLTINENSTMASYWMNTLKESDVDWDKLLKPVPISFIDKPSLEIQNETATLLQEQQEYEQNTQPVQFDNDADYLPWQTIQ